MAHGECINCGQREAAHKRNHGKACVAFEGDVNHQNERLVTESPHLVLLSLPSMSRMAKTGT